MAVQRRRREAASAPDDAGAVSGVSGVAAAHTAAPAFVGRDRELASIVDALAAPPALVLVEGEPGIGKTRLLREALAAPSLAQSKVLVAACPPLTEPFPLGPVIDGLRRLWQQAGDVELSPLGGALCPLFPEWANQLPPALEPLDDPKETRHRVLRALTELVERLTVDVLIVEDAHWADTATLEWLLTLTTSEDPGLSIVVTDRPTDVPEGSLLPRLTARSPAGMSQLRIVLEPLDVAQARLLVGSMLSTDEVSEEFASFLHEHADGVPLALEETVRLLRDRHDIVRQGGAWTRRVLDDLEVPPAVRDSVLERVTRLDDDTRNVLQAAAVLAGPADESLLAEVADVDERAGRHGVAAALVSGLLRELSPGRYVFRHVLDSQAVEGAIPVSERRRLHHRAATALQARAHSSAARLARHFREAGETESWCRYAEAAADLALKAGDDHTVVITLLDILNRVEHPLERRVRLAQKLFDAAWFGTAALGELAQQVVNALRAVLEANGLPQGARGELRLDLGRMLWAVGEALAAFEEIEAAVPDLDDRPDLAFRAMAILGMPSVPDWSAMRHLDWMERAADVVQRTGSASDRRAMMWIRAHAQLLLGEDAAWKNLPRTPVHASSLKEQRALAGFLLNLTWSLCVWGRYEEARQQFDAAVELIQTIDDQSRTTGASIAGAYLDWYTGNWQRLRDAMLNLTEEEEPSRLRQLETRQLQGLLDLVAGAKASAERCLREVADGYVRVGSAQPHDILSAAALGRLLLSDNVYDDALAATAPPMELIAQKGVWLWATDLAPVRLDALIGLGRMDEAADLVSQFTTGLGSRNAPAPAAAVRTCQAILAAAHGSSGEAATLFADAASAWAALPRPYDELLTLERRGRCLLAAGEQGEALAVLSDVQQRLLKLGASWDADRIARVLRRHGVEVARPNRRGPRGYGDQLSPRELEVIELVARGMTNKQIGEQLFLSPKTVDRHLRSARRKLGASTRTGAAMAAAKAGLLESEAEDPAG